MAPARRLFDRQHIHYDIYFPHTGAQTHICNGLWSAYGAPYPCYFCEPSDVTPARASSHVMRNLQSITSIHSLPPTPLKSLLSDCKHYDSCGPHIGAQNSMGCKSKMATDPCSFLRHFLGCSFCTTFFSNFGPRG